MYALFYFTQSKEHMKKTFHIPFWDFLKRNTYDISLAHIIKGGYCKL